MSSVFQNFFKKFLKIFFEAKIKPKRTRYYRPSLSNNLPPPLYYISARRAASRFQPALTYYILTQNRRNDATLRRFHGPIIKPI